MHNPAESFELNGVPGPVVIAEKEGQEIEDVRQDSVREVRGTLYRGVSHGVRLPRSGECSSPPIDTEAEIVWFLQNAPLRDVLKAYPNLTIEHVRYLMKKYGITIDSFPAEAEPARKPRPEPEPKPKEPKQARKLIQDDLDRMHSLLMDRRFGYEEIGRRIGTTGQMVRYYAAKWGLTSLRQKGHEALPEPKPPQVIVPQPKPAPAPVIEPEPEPAPVVEPGPKPERLAVHVPLGIVIEDNVPLPDRCRWQFLNDMKPGQSAFVPESYASTHAVKKRIYGEGVKGSKFATQSETKHGVAGVRVWKLQ